MLLSLITSAGRLCIPAFIYTSYYPSDWAKYVTLGLAGVFAIAESIHALSRSNTKSSSSSPKNLRQIKILCIDDDHVSRNLMRKTVQKISSNLEIRVAVDGQQGLQMISLFEPDVIFLDMMMDKMNGDEMAKQVQNKFPKYLDRIIVLSALDSKSKNVSDVVFMGCDYIKKPIVPEQVRNAVHKVCERHRLLENLQVVGEKLRIFRLGYNSAMIFPMGRAVNMACPSHHRFRVHELFPLPQQRFFGCLSREGGHAFSDLQQPFLNFTL
jgi:CheY-like chemotaxis protein